MYCLVCSDDKKATYDSCYNWYTLIDDNCVSCSNLFGNKCSSCSEKQCLKCSYGYGILNEETCSDCTKILGEGCASCGLSPYDLKPYCAECSFNYFNGKDGKCKKCDISNCKRCEELGINGLICISCEYGYELKEEKCLKDCGNNRVLGNDGECKYCYDIGLLNCKRCKKENDEYIYTECDYNYDLLNDKWIKIEEEEIKICSKNENISKDDTPIYFCVNCPDNDNNFIPIIKINGAKICMC